MKHFVLIACASRKLDHAAPAASIYASQLFKLNLAYARSLEPDAIYILSAKHGLLELDRVIEPYEVTLNGMPKAELQAWASSVRAALVHAGASLGSDRFTFLAGRNYRMFLADQMAHAHVPMEGLGIGQQLGFLTRAVRGLSPSRGADQQLDLAFHGKI